MTAKIIVKCIIHNKKLNRFLLVRRSENDDTGADTWENAGGSVESGETPEEAAKREVREETGIGDIRIGNIAYIALLHHEIPDLIIAYLCETDEEDVKLSSEHRSFVWADEQKCRSLLPAEIISDLEKNKVFDILNEGDHHD